MIVGPSAAGGMSDLVAHHHHMSGFAAHHHMGLGGMMAAGMVKKNKNIHPFLFCFNSFSAESKPPAVVQRAVNDSQSSKSRIVQIKTFEIYLF